MLVAWDDFARRVVFQSAPGREAGRCDHRLLRARSLRRFNPRPAVRPGDALLPARRIRANTCFNPRPAVRPGDAHEIALHHAYHPVSIRARP